MVNRNRKRGYEELDVTIRSPLPNIRQLQLWDAITGEKYELQGMIDKQAIRLKLALPPCGSALVVASTEMHELSVWHTPSNTIGEFWLDPGSWQYELYDHNVLVLDHPDCFGQAEGQAPFAREKMEFVRLDRDLRSHFGIDQRGGWMVQPWASKDKPISPSLDLTLTYKIHVETVPDLPVFLGLEQPDRWQIQLNGKAIDSDDAHGYWVDPAIKTLPVDTRLLQTGENTLTLKGLFDRLADLEIVYLLGTFGLVVEGNHTEITRLPEYLKLGNWANQGLPFYSGNIIYHSSFEF